MNDALAVGVIQCVSNVTEQLQRGLTSEQPGRLGGHNLGQRLALDAFHHNERRVRRLVLAHVIDGHNTGMGEPARGLGFTEEALAIMLGVCRAGSWNRNGFDGDGTVDFGIARAKNRSHGAAAKFSENFVASQLLHCFHRALILSLCSTPPILSLRSKPPTARLLRLSFVCACCSRLDAQVGLAELELPGPEGGRWADNSTVKHGLWPSP